MMSHRLHVGALMAAVLLLGCDMHRSVPAFEDGASSDLSQQDLPRPDAPPPDTPRPDLKQPLDQILPPPDKSPPCKASWKILPVKINSTTQSLKAVWGSGPKDVWMAGSGGVVLRYDGKTLKQISVPTIKTTYTEIRGVWGSGPKDVWLMELDKVKHYNGKAWSTLKLPGHGASMNPISVWGNSAKDVVIIGFTYPSSPPNHSLWAYHLEGGKWTQHKMPQGLTQTSYAAVWGTSPQNYFAVGDGGTVARFSCW